jgi:hypothetical protein
VSTQAEPADRAVRFEASEKDRAAAVDVGSESPADMRAPAEQLRRKAAEPETPQDEEDYTSRLLKAKRRARGADGDDAKGADKPDA